MEREELEEFAGMLSRRLAVVLAGENGYRETDCPDCKARERARDARRPATAGNVGCPTCAGTRRLWAKATSGRMVRRSDKELIALFGSPRR